MACIPRSIDIFMREWEYLFLHASEHAQDPTFFEGFTPRRGNWHTWDVAQLNPAQCRIAAKHAQEDICWEKMKTATVIAAGALFTVAATALLLTLAGSILFLTGGFFAGLLEVSAGIIALEIGIWSLIILGGTFATAHGVAALACLITVFWTKEFLPAIDRSAGYREHLQTLTDALMAKAENRG